jgi:hypothetical protein
LTNYSGKVADRDHGLEHNECVITVKTKNRTSTEFFFFLTFSRRLKARVMRHGKRLVLSYSTSWRRQDAVSA